ncbi:NUDIX domain-containing protein [Streptomyces sp. NPDC056178]
MPGGKVEPGGTPRAAAARELAEETGLAAELLLKPGHSSPGESAELVRAV